MMTDKKDDDKKVVSHARFVGAPNQSDTTISDLISSGVLKDETIDPSMVALPKPAEEDEYQGDLTEEEIKVFCLMYKANKEFEKMERSPTVQSVIRKYAAAHAKASTNNVIDSMFTGQAPSNNIMQSVAALGDFSEGDRITLNKLMEAQERLNTYRAMHLFMVKKRLDLFDAIVGIREGFKVYVIGYMY